ncbi:hypothetical protein ABZ897_07765 [Nonomuraea sp. NPDC046802]|uniref:hypothetical protein n=1 Tax=Nonomuraea sp. NPDC046802 TaxID=3154919 RepID=UPI0033F2E6E9
MEDRRPERALVVSSDLTGYGQGNDKRHEFMQAEFVAVHREAAEAVGLNRALWERQPGGDGELAVLPPGEAESLVVDGYVRALHTRLRERNRDLRAQERLRLRVAVAFGNAYHAANGYAGQAVVEVSRLLSWEPFKLILKRNPDVSLALILSKAVYKDTVLQGHTTHSAESFRKVLVSEKEYQEEAWVWVPDVDPADLVFDGESGVGSPPGNHGVGSQHAEAITNLHGQIDARNSVFGVNRA